MSLHDDVRIYLGASLRETPKVRIPLEEADEIADYYADILAPYCQYLIVAGSVRRRRPEVGDIEFVALPNDLDELLDVLDGGGFRGGKRIMRKLDDGLLIEVYIAHKPEELGAMSLAVTGDRQLNVAMRKKAKDRGLTLNQYGLWDARTMKRYLQSVYEGDFFKALGMPWHEPEDRSLIHR